MNLWLGADMFAAGCSIVAFSAGFLFAAMMSQRPLGALPTEWEPEEPEKICTCTRWITKKTGPWSLEQWSHRDDCPYMKAGKTSSYGIRIGT